MYEKKFPFLLSSIAWLSQMQMLWCELLLPFSYSTVLMTAYTSTWKTVESSPRAKLCFPQISSITTPEPYLPFDREPLVYHMRGSLLPLQPIAFFYLKIGRKSNISPQLTCLHSPVGKYRKICFHSPCNCCPFQIGGDCCHRSQPDG